MHVFPAAALLLVLSSAALAQQAPEPVSRAPRAKGELTAGVQYQTGKYGTGQRVKTTSAVAGARIVAGRVILSGSLPFTRIDAPGNVVPGGGILGLPIIVDPSRPATRVRRRGLGDARLGAAWVLPVKSLDLAAFAQLKLPTAGRRLGTGETDVALGAEASTAVGGLAPFASVTYTMPGQPDGYRLRNTWAGQIGVNASLGSNVSGQLAYGRAQSPGAGLADEQQLSARLTTGISSRVALSLQGAAGLSRSAADATAAVQLGWRVF